MSVDTTPRWTDGPVEIRCCITDVQDTPLTYLNNYKLFRDALMHLSLAVPFACLENISCTAAVRSLLNIIFDFDFDAHLFMC